MKHFIFSLLSIAVIFLTACSSTDPKALMDKINNDPESLTQNDYAAMIDCLDNLLSDKDKLEATFSNPGEDEFSTMYSALLGADMEGKLDAKNKKRYEELQKKTKKALEKIQQTQMSDYSGYDYE